MDRRIDEAKAERLYERALTIKDRRRPGLWLPIMWHLALRGHTDAMTELADWYCDDHNLASFGTPADAFSPAGLYRRAYRKNCARAAYNAAMSCFNRNDMTGYRRNLRKAYRAGDVPAGMQLHSFETRLPHLTAREIGRHRPVQKRDEYA